MKIKTVFFVSFFISVLYNIGFTSVGYGNIVSVGSQIGVVRSVKLKSGRGLNSVSGLGLGVFLRYKLSELYNIDFSYSYSDLEVGQDSVIKRWEWGFWDKFYGKYVSDLLSQDSVYAVEFNPVQRLYVNSVHLALERKFKTELRFTPFLKLGCGIHMFRRELVLKEHWFKHYPQIDYTFDFSFRNHAEPKSGVVIGFDIMGGIQTNILDPLSLEIGVDYSTIVPEAGRNFKEFPMEAFYKLFLRLSLSY